MPELAEVEHSRRQWDPGIGARVEEVIVVREDSRIFRGTDVAALRDLRGKTLAESEVRGKQMIFRFSPEGWLGVHLGMNGELRSEAKDAASEPRKHDYLTLRMSNGVALIFEDKRLFGRVLFSPTVEPPAWWTGLPPSVLSDEFTAAAMAAFLTRRARTPVKAALLMQERFPGVGNWMADEILWRAKLHPAALCGSFKKPELARLYRAVRWVCETAVRIVTDDWSYPETWLFRHRWEKGGHCPRCRAGLLHATIGGRTTCWCPACQGVA